MNVQNITLLAIESSCDDTAASVIKGGKICSNLVSSQIIHSRYGGVVPELASRSHQRHIIPVVQAALDQAGVDVSGLDAIAYTRGPGLMGSLLVGQNFAKGLAMALDIPMIGVNHLDAHVLASLIGQPLEFPYLCLLVSGGHTQIMKVESASRLTVLGKTLDDAAGEAFDKSAKILGLPYPGGPLIDKLAADGNPEAFSFSTGKVPGLDLSFSGFKTSVLYFVRDQTEKDAAFVETNLSDLCASVQSQIVGYLLNKLEKAVNMNGIKRVSIAGGVAANSALRSRFQALCRKKGWEGTIPPFEYCTDNAAMIGWAGLFKLMEGETTGLEANAFASV